jgi:hypothetical protein
MPNDKTNHKIKFLQLYPTTAADALLEINMAVISAALLPDKRLLQTNTSCAQTFCY